MVIWGKMIPFFKTDTSLGKSILTLDPSDPRSIFSLEGLPKKVSLVEDDMSNIFEAAKYFKEQNVQLIFGLRMTFANSNIPEEIEQSAHKNIVFAKNCDGAYDLMNLFSEYRNLEGVITYQRFLEMFTKNMELVVPFYDSYLHKNFLKSGNAIPNFGQVTPKFVVEKNGVAFDSILDNFVCAKDSSPTLVKSIYYNKRDDFRAWQAFKIICARKAYKQSDISNPNLEYCNSREFSWESYNEFKTNS